MFVRRFPWEAGRWRLIPYALQQCRQAYVTPELRVVRTRHGFRMKVDVSEWLGRHIFVTGEYEPATSAVFRACLSPGMTFIDVGANAGYFSLLASKCVGAGGKVLSFEPLPIVRRALTTNLELNAVRNCTVFDVALSNAADEVEFFAGPESHYGVSSLRPLADASQKIKVQTRRMDDVLDAGQSVDLVKIDVEGAEAHVLEGMTGVLVRCKPDVVLEVSPAYLTEMGRSVGDLDRIFAEHNYMLFAIENEGLRQLTDLSSYPSDQFNAFATRRGDLPRGIRITE